MAASSSPSSEAFSFVDSSRDGKLDSTEENAAETRRRVGEAQSERHQRAGQLGGGVCGGQVPLV
jgi:hypothetical protein